MHVLKKLAIVSLLLLITTNLVACNSINDKLKAQIGTALTSEKPKQSERLSLDNSYYKNDDNNSIKYVYVTVLKDQGKTNYIFGDLAKDDYQNDDYAPKVNVLLQEGNVEGSQNGYFGYGITDSNATMKVRGRSTRVNSYSFKSYKITLNKKIGEWNNFSELNLNKHPVDLTKMRNKLSFDYFKIIPDSATLRTQFVDLYIKDLTKTNPDKDFVHYGLYTNIDQADEKFLKRAGLDPAGNLYKTVNFEFQRYKDDLKNIDDPGYDKKKFEGRLEMKAGKDHLELLKMLDDVNNENLDIDSVVDKYFDRENYLTWMASNLIMGNLDTYSQNYYIYSPQNSLTWYFMPWDYDSAWGYLMQQGVVHDANSSWQNGLSNYGSNILHKRFFSKKANVDALTKKVEELRSIITKEKTAKMLEGYYGSVSKTLSQEPDVSRMPFKFSDIKNEMDRISNIPELNIADYYKSLKRPMPVFTGGPSNSPGNKQLFTWNKSYCPDGSTVKYDMQIATDPGFNKLIVDIKNLTTDRYEIDKLPKGTYFLKVTLKSDNGERQVTFDMYYDDKGVKYDGVRKVVVE